MADYIFRDSMEELDPDLSTLIHLEEIRQSRKIIMIASESQAPLAVREALGSVFQNIYAEGYPAELSRKFEQDQILDYSPRLAEYRRYSDLRYYKGVEYADIAESLARRRCADLFATSQVKSEDIYVNVQPLSGAPANNAVYHALIKPNETLMGLNLIHGGHLSHGSPVNRSGKIYNSVHYNVDDISEKLDYDQIEILARQHQPRIIIAGYSSYPLTIDWQRMKEIAASCGAFLLADIAHVAGLVAGRVFPSPLGYADVVTFTTHKSLCGPRGACILTTDRELARKIDRAVFPGEQGGPHVNVFVAMALAFKLAKSEEFRKLQEQTVRNAAAMVKRFIQRGFRIPFGGTDTHMLNIDCGSVTGPGGITLSGDQAARILDLAGIVTNRNTIPGDKNALDPSGIRLGTPWVTQRGFQETHVVKTADIIADLLEQCIPYHLQGRRGRLRRTKILFDALEQGKIEVRNLVQSVVGGSPTAETLDQQFYFIDDQVEGEYSSLAINGKRARDFLIYVTSSDVESLQPGQSQPTSISTPRGMITGLLTRLAEEEFQLVIDSKTSGYVVAWMRDISDGYVQLDQDLQRKIPGPVWIEVKPGNREDIDGEVVDEHKPYFIGDSPASGRLSPLPDFTWEDFDIDLRRTPLYDTHIDLGAKLIPFAGWEMPVWYSSVIDEHMAVRNSAGIFDVAHMGIYQVEGDDAALFLDGIVGNDIGGLAIGESCYTHFLDPEANVLDDLLVYHRDRNKYMLVVNASNDDKDWSWIKSVQRGDVRISNRKPWARAYGRNVKLRNLRDPEEGASMRVDIALQGQSSREILLALGADDHNTKKIVNLRRTQLCDAKIGKYDLVISRTGYTGENMAFELFVHPDHACDLFSELLEVGERYGLRPIGLGARDSLRTEAGLPLYGHEMGGAENLSVGDAGFSSYVKVYKPWFIGRQTFLNQEESRKSVVVRFRFNDRGVRLAHYKDPVLDKRGKVIGFVTSCAVDRYGSLTGQAYLDLKSAEIGTAIFVFQSASTKQSPAPADLDIGDRTTIPTPATVISRFPKL